MAGKAAAAGKPQKRRREAPQAVEAVEAVELETDTFGLAFCQGMLGLNSFLPTHGFSVLKH